MFVPSPVIKMLWPLTSVFAVFDVNPEMLVCPCYHYNHVCEIVQNTKIMWCSTSAIITFVLFVMQFYLIISSMAVYHALSIFCVPKRRCKCRECVNRSSLWQFIQTLSFKTNVRLSVQECVFCFSTQSLYSTDLKFRKLFWIFARWDNYVCLCMSDKLIRGLVIKEPSFIFSLCTECHVSVGLEWFMRR